jgi:hypothetical protein
VNIMGQNIRILYVSIGIAMIIGLVTLVVVFGTGKNTPPVVDEFIIPDIVEPGGKIQLRVIAHDVDGDQLTYTWHLSDETEDSWATSIETGTEPTFAERRYYWSVPNGRVLVEVYVHDGVNAPVVRQGFVKVTEPK